MLAAHVDRYGPPEVLQLRETPRPQVAPSEVLVEVRASPVTAGDLRLRAADFPGLFRIPGLLVLGVRGPRKPVQGTFFAGRVVEVGGAVTRYAVGDLVFGFSGAGAYAGYVAMNQDAPMAPVPAGISLEDAAATPYGAFTALHFLRTVGDVRPGERLLVVGASGGVGRFAVQLARHLGAEVTAVCGPRSVELVRSLGADHVIDHTREDFAAGAVPYDVIFDTAGVASLQRCRPVLAPGGRLLTILLTAQVLVDMFVSWWRGGPSVRTGSAFATREDMAEIARLLEQGVVRPVIGRRLPLEQVAEAHRAAAAGDSGGAVLVTIGTLTPP